MTQWTRSDKKRHQRNQKLIQIIPENEHNLQLYPQTIFLVFSYIHLHERSKSNHANDDDDDIYFICFGQQ